MPKIESYAPGLLCWAELATSDVPAAQKFYTEMFGWNVFEVPMPEGSYTLFRIDGEDVAAATIAQGGAPPHWGLYFSVANVDESAGKIAGLGGKVIAGPFDVMDIGRMAVAQDPQGAIFSLWQAVKHIGATYGGSMGMVSWPELSTPDPVASVAFYSALFGWGTKPSEGVEGAQYVEWLQNGRSMGGLIPMRGDMWQGIPPHWMAYVTVADCDERAAKATELGGKVHMPPTDIPNTGRFSVIADPQGAVIAIIKLAAGVMPASA